MALAATALNAVAAQAARSVPPFVSVIVPARNEEQAVSACIESLLRQDYPKDRYELIMVDNDSTDGTAARIKAYPVTYVFERAGHSAAAARNRGLQEASGEILAFTDADCVAAPSWLRHGVAGFADAQIGSVAGDIHGYPPETTAQRYVEERRALSQAWAMTEAFRPYAQTASAFYRTSVLDRIGTFDPVLKVGEDADLAWRMQERLGLQVAFRPESVVFHKHPETIRELLRQRRGYGYSSVVLYLRYQERMERWTLKHTYWNVRSLAKRMGRLAEAAGRCAVSSLRGRGNWEVVVMAWLDVCVYLSWKLGQLQGSIRHRVWYV